MSTARYVITNKAVADLHEIWEYIADDSPDAADRVFQELLTECERIANSPDIGHAREDLVSSHAVKFWSRYKYFIVYRIDRTPIEIIAIVHGARDVESLMKER